MERDHEVGPIGQRDRRDLADLEPRLDSELVGDLHAALDAFPRALDADERRAGADEVRRRDARVALAARQVDDRDGPTRRQKAPDTSAEGADLRSLSAVLDPESGARRGDVQIEQELLGSPLEAPVLRSH
ncbi:MAG: hypothetical protein HYY06_28585 [Deltaproteobacteria bacterium]|nr:hypothetical protein [Deltaproteobacteria bacterium]